MPALGPRDSNRTASMAWRVSFLGPTFDCRVSWSGLFVSPGGVSCASRRCVTDMRCRLMNEAWLFQDETRTYVIGRLFLLSSVVQSYFAIFSYVMVVYQGPQACYSGPVHLICLDLCTSSARSGSSTWVKFVCVDLRHPLYLLHIGTSIRPSRLLCPKHCHLY